MRRRRSLVASTVAAGVMLLCAAATYGQEAPAGGAASRATSETGPETAEDAPLDLPDAGPEAAGRAARPSYYLLRALLSLAIVVALIYAVFFGIKTWRRRHVGPRRGATTIEVLDAANIDADKTVYVVALGPKTIVLGGSGTELMLICELNPAEAESFRAEAKGFGRDAEQSALPDNVDSA
ncbi:MAG: flagellar biosynthetic protein FliO [Armatimonadota bacterium]|jgi:flagellar biogenesis protein FliO